MRLLKNSYWAAILLLSIILLIRVMQKNMGVLESYLAYLAHPFIFIQKNISSTVDNFTLKHKSYSELVDSLEKYISHNDNLIQENIELRAFIAEHNLKDELIEFKQKYEQANINGIIAQIVFKQISSNGHFFIIDVGSNKGAYIDMAVVYRDMLVGRISEVYPGWSKVLLITDRDCKVACMVARTQVKGIHEGYCEVDKTSLNFVGHLSDVKPDDFIISSGEGLIFPQGFGVAKVETVQNSEFMNGIYYQISAKPIIELDKLNYCYVIQKS